ncbi:MAG: ATP-dependent DNA helicase, partial [Candidatus Roizmanbacteria bacterium]|nr:ATP-dependent DNA helicase [Candidatus Roizmanbacteria bacterium]
MSAFQKVYTQLNEKQRLAVDAIEGPVMVIAGPGTGKTQILTLRIANILLKTQVNPENILALTFTENAAAEMKERLSGLIGPDAFRVQINTFHGFCNELIQKHFDIFHHLASYMPISALEEIQMIQEIIESESFIYLRPQGDPTYYFHPIRSALSSLKKEGVSPGQFKKAIGQWKSDFEKRDDLINIKGKYKGKMKGAALDEIKNIEKNTEFAKVFEIYQQKMQEKKLYDFNDMIIEVVKAFKRSDEFLSQIRETYQYILVDEHQDTNNAQNTIIEYICSIDDFPNLFVVGDEKQSIFRFQGASLENFLYFKKTFPRATLIHLEENYRSTQKILDTAQAVIQNNTQSISGKTQLIAKSLYPEVAIELIKFSNPHQEYFEIAQLIKKLSKEGVPYEQIAVILRKNADLLTLTSVLENNDVPAIMSTDESVFSDVYIQKIISLLKAIYFVGDDSYLSRILLMDIFMVDPLAVFTFIQGAHKQKCSLWDYAKEKGNPPLLVQTIEKLIAWKKQSENESIDEFFIKLLHESGIMEKILKEYNSLSILEKLHVLYEDIKELQRKNHLLSLQQYLEYLALLEEHTIAPHIKVTKRKTGSVFVTTAHKAKGLEFEYVFIPKTTDSYWGNARGQSSLIHIPWKYLSRTELTQEKDETIEEERRLFYVAITRAKKQLLLTYSSQNEEGKEQLSSRFVFEIPQEYIHTSAQIELPSGTEQRIISRLSPQKQKPDSFNKDEMQTYIRSLFIHNGISVSALNNFITCPWRYVFRNLIRLPDVRGYYLLLGTAVHETIREYISQKKNNNVWDEEKLLQYFMESTKNYSASEKDLIVLTEKGSKIISSYYQKRMKKWDGNRESELVVPNIYLDVDISINGKIDMIELQKNHEVIVYDFKTGKAKSRNALLGATQAKNKDYYRQLVFYKLLLSLYKKGQYKMNTGVIEFVESAVEGDIKSESFTIEESEVKELIQQ